MRSFSAISVIQKSPIQRKIQEKSSFLLVEMFITDPDEIRMIFTPPMYVKAATEKGPITVKFATFDSFAPRRKVQRPLAIKQTEFVSGRTRYYVIGSLQPGNRRVQRQAAPGHAAHRTLLTGHRTPDRRPGSLSCRAWFAWAWPGAWDKSDDTRSSYQIWLLEKSNLCSWLRNEISLNAMRKDDIARFRIGSGLMSPEFAGTELLDSCRIRRRDSACKGKSRQKHSRNTRRWDRGSSVMVLESKGLLWPLAGIVNATSDASAKLPFLNARTVQQESSVDKVNLVVSPKFQHRRTGGGNRVQIWRGLSAW
ncbi:hypothetical protein BDP27DRAFT_1376686 [Rhodocollybia butyracea]|uniref:Uncharacterized protein n=1 Tax=Rhodocollybia butyracea TaxID=206335 RepID=A0A9P5P3Y2_9AGAR|nr:hypothetical protein BDP27DRAFT_1376686 [Rhodocollybia butyracea]